MSPYALQPIDTRAIRAAEARAEQVRAELAEDPRWVAAWRRLAEDARCERRAKTIVFARLTKPQRALWLRLWERPRAVSPSAQKQLRLLLAFDLARPVAGTALFVGLEP